MKSSVLAESLSQIFVEHFTCSEDVGFHSAQRKFEDCGDFLVLFLFNMP